VVDWWAFGILCLSPKCYGSTTVSKTVSLGSTPRGGAVTTSIASDGAVLGAINPSPCVTHVRVVGVRPP